jgi:formate hydrogenlyase subunit 3/multisubunit Na+/H+ antiporter MnhD subunit
MAGALISRVQERMRLLFFFSSTSQVGNLFIALGAENLLNRPSGLGPFGVTLGIYTVHLGLLGNNLFNPKKSEARRVRALGVELQKLNGDQLQVKELQLLFFNLSGLPGRPLFMTKLITGYRLSLTTSYSLTVIFFFARVRSVAYH